MVGAHHVEEGNVYVELQYAGATLVERQLVTCLRVLVAASIVRAGLKSFLCLFLLVASCF